MLALVHLFVTVAVAQDPYCPRYPDQVRSEIDSAIELDAAAASHSRKYRAAGSRPEPVRLAQSPNFIDQLAGQKMSADGVKPAGRTSDAEFLRRIYLDLTGRIPSPEKAEAFLADTDTGKRDKLIDELLANPAYADQMTTFLINRFKVTRSHESVSTEARDVFYRFVRQLFTNDQPYNDFVRQLISSAGEVDTAPGTQFFARWMDISGPNQDSWDNITDKITTSFLGYKTECVSCHNGRAHLEKINLHLSRRSRHDFWQMSAFLSRMQFVRLSDDPIGFRPRIVVVDRAFGSYTGAVPPSNPGCRPARIDAVVDPVYFTNGAAPRTGAWRQELAQMVVSDRQFALATANYFWSYFFGYGIVDPADAWDLDRQDPKAALPGDWTVQNSNPDLLNQLADYLVRNQFRLKPLIRQIVTSDTYQLSSKYDGVWKPAYVRYFARHEARRLTAEQMYDAMITATRTEQPMMIGGPYSVLMYANQLPDPTEPFNDSRVMDFMNQLGRGNWMTIDRTSEPTVLGMLFQMNDPQNVNRSLGLSGVNIGVANRVRDIDAKYPDDTDAIRRMYLATLTRYPSERELSLVLARRSGPRYQWLSDLQWALLNKLDFVFNY